MNKEHSDVVKKLKEVLTVGEFSERDFKTDEAQHFSESNTKKDFERQSYIENNYSCKFIRCDYRDSDIKNLAKVMKEI